MLCYYGGRLRLHLLAIVVADRRLDTTATRPDDHLQMTRWRRARPGCIISPSLAREATRAGSPRGKGSLTFHFFRFMPRAGVSQLSLLNRSSYFSKWRLKMVTLNRSTCEIRIMLPIHFQRYQIPRVR